MEHPSKQHSANQHTRNFKKKQGRTFFWLFLLPVLLIALFTAILGLWSLNTLGEQNRARTEYAKRDLDLLVEISHIEQQMVAIHQLAADNLVNAAKGIIDEGALYRIHSEIVDDLADLGEKIKVLTESLEVVSVDHESAQIMSESYGQYRNFLTMATDIAAIDPKQAKLYIDNAQNFFMDMITHRQIFFASLIEHINKHHSINTQSYNNVFKRLIRGTFVGLLVMLLVSTLLAKMLSRWLSKVATSLNLLAQTKGAPLPLPDMTRMQQNGIGEFKDMAMATLAFRRTIQERYEVENQLRTYQNDLEELVARRTRELQRYFTAIDDLGIGLCVIDADYHVHIKNRTLIGWFGDQSGKTCHSVFMEQDSPCSFCKLKKIIEQGEKTHYQFTRSDGRTFEIVATPISNSDGTISCMEIIRDITEQIEHEERKLETSRQLEQLKRLESLKTMAGAIAHHFNNSMMTVLGNLELLQLDLPGGSREKKLTSQAFYAAQRASRVGSMMLSYVGQHPTHLQKVSLSDFVREIVTAFKDLSQSSISLKFTPPAQPLYCSMDKQQIQEVIESILANAVESMDNASGTVAISFGKDFFKKDSFPIPFQNDNLKDDIYSFCQIKDIGHGIDQENLSRIFEPFYTTRFVGRGLGLALTVGVMQAHHGAITIESSADKGTTVRVLLPSISLSQQTMPSLEGAKTKRETVQ